jgi:hypothetical protein
MKQILVMMAAVVLVGCGKEEPAQKQPELRSENIITPDEAANELFVEAVVLVNEAKAQEVSDVEVAIKKYEEAFAKLQKIISDYKKSALAVKLISGETLFDGKSLEQVRMRLLELVRMAEAKAAAEAQERALTFEKAVRARLEKPEGELTEADWENVILLDELQNTKITDSDLKEVAKLKSLMFLFLNNTKVTDATLKELAKLQNLEVLDLDGTKVTKAGVAELKKALPNCEILGP